jgi:hypothetical protein
MPRADRVVSMAGSNLERKVYIWGDCRGTGLIVLQENVAGDDDRFCVRSQIICYRERERLFAG